MSKDDPDDDYKEVWEDSQIPLESPYSDCEFTPPVTPINPWLLCILFLGFFLAGIVVGILLQANVPR